MARQRKSSGAGGEAESERKGPEALPQAPVREEVPAVSPLDVLVELSRMATVAAGGSCVLFRKPPAISPEVYAEIRRLCLAVSGAKETAAIPAYCFDRDAKDVLAEIVKGLGR